MDLVLLGLRVLAAVALYSFLVLIFVTLRRDLRAASEPDDVARRSARLIVVEAADQTVGVGSAFTLQPVTSIGRGPGNTISIPDSFASMRHALVSWRGGQWWVEDQGSRNSTMLNDVTVARPTVIASGDIIRVGRTAFRLEREDGSWADG